MTLVYVYLSSAWRTFSAMLAVPSAAKLVAVDREEAKARPVTNPDTPLLTSPAKARSVDAARGWRFIVGSRWGDHCERNK